MPLRVLIMLLRVLIMPLGALRMLTPPSQQQVFDRQKTGVISAQDLRHLFTKLGEKMEDAEVGRSLCQKNPPSDTPVS